ncbi:pyruvate kinase [Halanaerobium saccharolyticum]|uniref:Pyruvate kinase n=1 Tax=Halanaerobium saccharolyticum TaxID=43595 RepID=A0A4R7Z2I0_9FIRM|nr:pyruvate kinase [Halanaerobium saccharolyticum]RAK07140.1 pyruvate kinase [Halanaerobium saccharolyticum]TDW01848.1 pyruvate kinase [Halanaerobium saccharolyticum]TDX53094.1 pyruvate kinase [Halanaerobium saccharolyticum]
MRKTKIVCTLGPATNDKEIIKEVVEAGMDVARMNFSHGDHAEHKQRMDMVKAAEKETGKTVGIMLDTKGPEIRTGEMKGDKIQLEAETELVITKEDVEGTTEMISVSYKDLAQDMEAGNKILIDDGLIELEVTAIDGEDVVTRVVNGGELGSRKGVNLPGVKVSLPALTEKDISDIRFGVEQGIHFIAASFVRKANDVIEIRKILEESGNEDIFIIAKIENQEGVENLDAILEVADGIMVARGDLGVEIPAEKVPIVQKIMIRKCNEASKPVITATQMLDSMIRNPRPTRAEASDVANAIYDGTDATMLSGESAAGKYPVESVKTMAQIAKEVENSESYKEKFAGKYEFAADSVTTAISLATCQTAEELGAEAVITSTGSGLTARTVSKYRPQTPIIAVTPNKRVLHQLAMTWGVSPLLAARSSTTDEMMDNAISTALEHKLIDEGDLVTITAGTPVGISGTTNLIKVDVVGKPVADGQGIGKSIAVGKAKLVKTAEEAMAKIEEGDIMIAPMTDRDFVPAMKKAAAVVTFSGGLTSHPAIVGLNIGIPVVVNTGDISDDFKDGEVITVDGVRGLVYRGKAHLK